MRFQAHYFFVFILSLLVACEAQEADPEEDVTECIPCSEGNFLESITDTLRISRGPKPNLSGEDTVFLNSPDKPDNFLVCDFDSIPDNFENTKILAMTGRVFETDTCISKHFQSVIMDEFHIIEFCQTPVDTVYEEFELVGDWVADRIILNSDTLLVPCEIQPVFFSIGNNAIGISDALGFEFTLSDNLVVINETWASATFPNTEAERAFRKAICKILGCSIGSKFRFRIVHNYLILQQESDPSNHIILYHHDQS